MKLTLLLILTTTMFFGCKKASIEDYSVDPNAESAQQVGDAMASLDESGGQTNGNLAVFDSRSYQKTFVRLANEKPIYQSSILKLALPEAQAAACGTVAFSGCAANQRTRDFTGCTFGTGGSMSGNVVLTFAGTGAGSCTIPGAGDSVSRVPNFSIIGMRGATFAVSATSTGQSVTRVDATHFDFANAGIRRKFTAPSGTVLLDVTSSTSTPISVTGISRAARTMTGGGLTIVNNLTAVSCTLTPTGVSWSAGCNCPTAGSWSGACSDSKNFTVAFSGTCGQVSVTKGTDPSTTVTMDRCE